jgi:hypothetical protein
MSSKRHNMKRYNLDLPVDLFNELKQVADHQNTTMVEVIRKFIKLGLTLEKVPESTLYIREGDAFSRLIVL